MLKVPDEASFMMSLGGQGNAACWTLHGRSRVALADATYGRSARTVLLVTWGATQTPMHRLVGQRTWSARLGELEVGTSPLRLEHPSFQVEIPGVPVGRWYGSLEAYACEPHGFLDGANEDHFAAVVTLWIRLTPPGTAGDCGEQDGSAVSLYVNELGFVLCDAPRVDRILDARSDEISAAGGILEAVGSTSVGEELLDDGAFFPIWGMRPWLYRIATQGAGATLCPLGHEVASPLVFRMAEVASRIRVIPGDCLRGATRIDWARWPVIDLPGTGDGLKISSFVSGGPEPIDPHHAVGIVPTVWLARTPEVPRGANSARYTLTSYDPLSRYPVSAGVERAVHAAGAKPTRVSGY